MLGQIEKTDGDAPDCGAHGVEPEGKVCSWGAVPSKAPIVTKEFEHCATPGDDLVEGQWEGIYIKALQQFDVGGTRWSSIYG